MLGLGMSDESRDEEETRRLVVAINEFLREQLNTLTDLSAEDRDCLEIAIQCLEMAFGLENGGYFQHRYPRPLLDIFNQVMNPVTVKDKLRADAYKEEGNSYMTRSMYSEAEAEYTQAIELDKWNAIYYCNRASSRTEQQKFFDAIADCRQALMLNPDYAKAHARMGQAYALLHRPREAARCFRQALQLEPGNERYRNNLRVAEGQIENRPDPLNLITTLLNSVFEMRPTTSNDSSSRLNLPTSFMIITESHPPRRNASAEDSQPAEANLERNRNTNNANDETQNIVYPRPFGVFNVGSAEEPIPQVDASTANRDDDDPVTSGEFIIEIPGLSYFENDIPRVCPSNSCVDSTHNADKKSENQTDEKTSENDSQTGNNVAKRIKTSHPSEEEVETETAQQNLQNGKSEKNDTTLKDKSSNSADQSRSVTGQNNKITSSNHLRNSNIKGNDQIADDSEIVIQVVDKISRTIVEEEETNRSEKSENKNAIESSSMNLKEQNKNNNEQEKNVAEEKVSDLNGSKENSQENKPQTEKEDIKSSKEKLPMS